MPPHQGLRGPLERVFDVGELVHDALRKGHSMPHGRDGTVSTDVHSSPLKQRDEQCVQIKTIMAIIANLRTLLLLRRTRMLLGTPLPPLLPLNVEES